MNFRECDIICRVIYAIDGCKFVHRAVELLSCLRSCICSCPVVLRTECGSMCERERFGCAGWEN